MIAALALLSGCCGRDLPQWSSTRPTLAVPLDSTATVDLRTLVTDDRGETLFTADGPPELVVEVADGTLFVTAQPGFIGSAEIVLEAIDPCGGSSLTTLSVLVGADPDTVPSTELPCDAVFTYESPSTPSGVSVAGTFNAWDPEINPMEEVSPGVWRTTVALAPGAYPYKFVEIEAGAFGDTPHWICDAAQSAIHCEDGAVDPFSTSFDPTCVLDASPCNSLRVVASCVPPTVSVTAIDLQRTTHAATFHVEASAGAAAIQSLWTRFDGVTTDHGDAGSVDLELTDLSAGRHQLVIGATDAQGRVATEVVIPWWIDGPDWDEGLMYFAFVDRVSDGDAALNSSEGATAPNGDYAGGDLAGLIAVLPYLADLGVTSLWVSNLADNAEGAWSGDCGQTYAAYHAYWPDHPSTIETHFGDEATVHTLVDGAHDLGMRVVMDWVGNHVHETHPYVVDHPDWFTPELGCKDTINGGLGFDTIPETCWFAPYLPDLNYTAPAPLAQMVEDAVDFAADYDLDGFRVDAVKHMSHAVAVNLDAAIDARLEHVSAGGDENFYTVGETFDGHDRIAAYIGPRQLDGQFDFPQYYAIRDGFAHDADLSGLLDTASTSRAVFGDALMGVFLGNHDVARFATDAAESDLSSCGDSGPRVALAPADGRVYDRLRLAFAWVLTQPGVPLVYYGDEIGLPGYGDPDNRQPLWWHVGDEAPTDVEALANQIATGPASVLRLVRDLTAVRRAHPALRTGSWTEWWREPALVGFARVLDDDAVLVLINRSDVDRTLSNGLAFAALPQGSYTESLTGETVSSSGDSFSVTVPAWGVGVWVHL